MVLGADVLFGQIKGKLDTETLTLLGRLVIRAVKSGNVNEYLKPRLERILDEDDRPAPAAASARVVKR